MSLKYEPASEPLHISVKYRVGLGRKEVVQIVRPALFLAPWFGVRGLEFRVRGLGFGV